MQNVYLKARYKDSKPGRIIPLDEQEAANVIAMGIGELVDPPTPADEQEQAKSYLTIEEFMQLNASSQKEVLAGLSIDGDVGNEKNRVELYTSFLEQINNGGEK